MHIMARTFCPLRLFLPHNSKPTFIMKINTGRGTIPLSALLGIGSGLIIPLSTGLISRYFTGEYRVKQFGYSSALTNVTLVVATAVTGYLAEANWHLPFIVYLLSPFITDFFQSLFHTGSKEFPFIFNLCVTVLAIGWACFRRKDFLFADGGNR